MTPRSTLNRIHHPGERGVGRARRAVRRALAVAGLAAVVGLVAPGLASPAAAEITTCTQESLGSTGWSGDITGNPSTGWSSGELAAYPGVPGWANTYDGAVGQTVSHAVTGLPATGAQIDFSAWWRQAFVGGGNLATATANLQVIYGGVVYATISTPGPNNQFQRATVVASNGATITPAFPDRQTGLAGQSLTSFTLDLPDGVPANGILTYSMSWSLANGPGVGGAADDFFVTIPEVTQCTTTPEVDLAVEKTATEFVAPGGLITWSVTLANVGPDEAGTWTLTDTIPAGVTGISVVSGPGCSVSGSVITCTGGPLAPSATETFTFTGVAPSTESTINLLNTVSVSTPNDINPSNDTDEAPTQIDPEYPWPVIDPAVAAAVVAVGGAGVLLVGRRNRQARA